MKLISTFYKLESCWFLYLFLSSASPCHDVAIAAIAVRCRQASKQSILYSTLSLTSVCQKQMIFANNHNKWNDMLTVRSLKALQMRTH